MMLMNDTIAAVATAPGVGAVALIRVSGSEAFSLSSKIISSSTEVVKLEDRKACFTRVLSTDGESIDDVLLTPFHGPRSFTGEDTVEIACHGGVLVTKKVLQRLLEVGVKAAEAGEFSKRAFENGKLDLTQAEAIMDVISAQTDLALKAANDQLQGHLGKQAMNLREQVIEVLAHVEAYIDFPEEDIDPSTGASLVAKIDALVVKIEGLLGTAEQGRILREGLKTVICGEPNVGKSSLLNALLGFDRAIVSDVAGTTRDTVEEVINLKGIPLRLVDTAGIRESSDFIESKGIERSKQQIDTSALIIEVVDGSKAKNEATLLGEKAKEGKKHLLVLNKSDLGIDPSWQSEKVEIISTHSASSVDQFSENLVEFLSFSSINSGGHMLAINARHQACLKLAKESLEKSKAGLLASEASEYVCLDLREAMEYIGDIAGRVDNEEIFDEIFGTFCIGK